MRVWYIIKHKAASTVHLCRYVRSEGIRIRCHVHAFDTMGMHAHVVPAVVVDDSVDDDDPVVMVVFCDVDAASPFWCAPVVWHATW